jgi:UDP-4-amino-4,6-dideoxy-N-acetyl-beta-L-altrosamine transaminase
MPPVKKIPYARQDISDDDLLAVINVLKSEFLTHGGPVVPQFESAVSGYCGANYGVATNSATSALHIACLAMNVGPGDLVWTSPMSFVASANCALYCGAKIDFVDINPLTKNMSVDALAVKLESASRAGNLPKVVIPVHLCGQSCEMAEIFELSKKYGFKIIEDASHAIGGYYMNKPIGSLQYSDIVIFSFHPVKIITSGEGGMAVCNDESLYEKMIRFRSHGITSNLKNMLPRPNDEIWNYQQVDLGFNYRLSEIHAGLGLSQLSRIDDFVKKRHELAQNYSKKLLGLPLSFPLQHPDTYSSFHLFPICIDLKLSKLSQVELYRALDLSGISVNLHYIPIYLQPYYENLGFSRGYCEEAERYYQQTISLPMYFSLEDSAQEYVIHTLRKLLQ